MSKDERDSRHAKTESPAQWIGQAIFVCPLKPGGIIGPVLFVYTYQDVATADTISNREVSSAPCFSPCSVSLEGIGFFLCLQYAP